MAKKFFDNEWEKLTTEELSRARAKLSGFIEATPDKEKNSSRNLQSHATLQNSMHPNRAHPFKKGRSKDPKSG